MKQLETMFLKAYEDYSQAIFRHCYFRVFNRERAKDLMQETFMKTWEYLSKGEPVDNLRAFLYKVANNLVIDNSRKKQEASLDQMQEDGFDVPDGTRDRLMGFLQGGDTIRVLSRLSPKHRQAVYMRFVEDMDVKEIAQAIGESENNISVRIHRGLEQLRDLLEYE